MLIVTLIVGSSLGLCAALIGYFFLGLGLFAALAVYFTGALAPAALVLAVSFVQITAQSLSEAARKGLTVR
ncbi:hypothetical protein [uncultured Lentibacter sp.]|mgnify:CR=1 FL=1|jgi:hypothetical protein|uniref:hypothetical protein n=1 Tax=uncultured Lentibacter sp. TaxID=1659309 RepID=UPI002639BBBC|nr:hypothetical protein [uncultured Lentibacter sp.]